MARKQSHGIEQRIADLEARISAIKEREALKQAKSDPALRHAGDALRSIDRALSATTDEQSRRALLESRAWLSSALQGVSRASQSPPPS